MKTAYLLDTGPAFDFLFERNLIRERIRAMTEQGCKVGIGVPTLGEIIAGLEGSASRDESWKIAHRTMHQLVLWPFDKLAAYEYGLIFAQLKKKGRVIQQIDMQIAAIAKSKAKTMLVTYDSDFAFIPGLSHENWRT